MQIKLITAKQGIRQHMIVVNPCQAILNYMDTADIRYIHLSQFSNKQSQSVMTDSFRINELKEFMTLIGYEITTQDVTHLQMGEMMNYV